MAHFDRKSATSIHRIFGYGSFAVLGFQPNCTHLGPSSAGGET